MSCILKYVGIGAIIILMSIAVAFNKNMRIYEIQCAHNDQMARNNQLINSLHAEICILKQEKRNVEKEKHTIKEEIIIVNQIIEDLDNSPNFKSIGNYTITAYTAGVESCGKFTDGITATGKEANHKHRIIAADWDILPVGSCVYIESLGWYTVEDCGSAIKGKRIDVLMDDVETAMDFGKQKLRVWVKSPC